MVLMLVAPAATLEVRAQLDNTPLWVSTFNGSAENLDEATALAVSPNGATLYVTGLTNGIGPDEQYATVAYDVATGSRVWLSLHNSSPCLDTAVALAVGPDGARVFVTGYSGCLGGEDYITVGYDAASGKELWTARYDGPTGDPDEPAAIAVSPDGGRVFVTGRSFGFLGDGRDFATVAYDAPSGRELWAKRYVGPGLDEESSDDEARGIVLSPDGSTVFVTGPSVGTVTSNDYATVSYDAASGDEHWVARYDGPPSFDDFATAIGASPDGSKVYVTGYSFGDGTFSDITTLAYQAASGHELWVRRRDGAAGGFDAGYALATSPDGTKLFVTGYAEETRPGYPDYMTLAYDADGDELWGRSYDGPGGDSDTAHDVGVSPDGATVFVTGLSAGTFDREFPFDCTTLAYRASDGAVKWLGRYNGPANQSDVGQALAVSPDGERLYVTGVTEGLVGTGFDYLTLAYDTDPVLLLLDRGPGPGEVVLSWVGRMPPFSIYRSEDPSAVIGPANLLGVTSGSVWVDVPPRAGLQFYLVVGD